MKCHLKFSALEETPFGGSWFQAASDYAATHAKSSTPSSIHKGEPSTATRTELYQGYGLPGDLKHLSCTNLSCVKNIKLRAIARTRKHAWGRVERIFWGIESTNRRYWNHGYEECYGVVIPKAFDSVNSCTWKISVIG